MSSFILNDHGRVSGMYDVSMICYLSTVIIGSLIIFEDMKFFDYFTVSLITLHIILNIISYSLYETFRTNYMVSGIQIDMVSNLTFWLSILLISSVCLVPFFWIRYLEYFFGDSIVNNLRTNNYHKDFLNKKYTKILEELSKCMRSIVKFKMIFKNSNFEPENYSGKVMKEIVDTYRLNRKRLSMKKENIGSMNMEDIISKAESKRMLIDY